MKNEQAVRELKKIVGFMNEIDKGIDILEQMDVRVIGYRQGSIQLLYGIDDVVDAVKDDKGYYSADFFGVRVFEV